MHFPSLMISPSKHRRSTSVFSPGELPLASDFLLTLGGFGISRAGS